MSLNRFFSVMHGDIIMCLVSNERRENTLDNEAYTVKPRLEAHMGMILSEVFLKNIHLIPEDQIVQ